MRYVLVSSNGTEISSKVFSEEEEAKKALRSEVEGYFDSDDDEGEKEYSWCTENSAFVCALDCDIDEDWSWEILEIDETSEAIKYLLEELEANKKLAEKGNEEGQILVAKARIVIILNVLKKLGYKI